MQSVWSQWHAHPDVLVGLTVLEGVYLLGMGYFRKRYGLARKSDSKQMATFTAGVVVIFVALLSPLHVLSDTYLFSAHMLQHVLLTLVAPPLLIRGTPDWLIRPLLRPDWILRTARYATHPVVAFASFSLVFSIWHMPALYDTSVTNHGVHIAEHLIFIITATLMWWPIASKMPELPPISHPMQMLYLFLLSVSQIILFAPITFSKEPLYEWYVSAPRLWNVSPLVDQQIGGIIMKLGGGAIFMTLIIVAFFRWFGSEDRRTKNEVLDVEYHRYNVLKDPKPEDILR